MPDDRECFIRSGYCRDVLRSYTWGEVYENLEALNPIKDDDTLSLAGKHTSKTIESAISVAMSTDGTVIYFDHWEDGYEADILNPIQDTTWSLVIKFLVMAMPVFW